MLEDSLRPVENSGVQVRKTRLWWVLLTLILVSSACRKDAPRPEPGPGHVSRANFKAGEIRAINPSDRPEAQGKAAEEAPKVIKLLNDFYSTAFLDRRQWSGGTHARLAEFLTDEARPHLAPNLGGLALADLAQRVTGLRPTKQEAPRISFLVEDDLSVPIGVVNATFEARATPVKGKAPIAVVHNASFWVVKEADAYKIYAYQAELRADSQARSAAFGVPPEGSTR